MGVQHTWPIISLETIRLLTGEPEYLTKSPNIKGNLSSGLGSMLSAHLSKEIWLFVRPKIG